MWKRGLTSSNGLVALFDADARNEPPETYNGTLVQRYCDSTLGNETFKKQVKEAKFDVALVDLLASECLQALLHNYSVPSKFSNECDSNELYNLQIFCSCCFSTLFASLVHAGIHTNGREAHLYSTAEKRIS